jgi:hypothetical protein
MNESPKGDIKAEWAWKEKWNQVSYIKKKVTHFSYFITKYYIFNLYNYLLISLKDQ